MVESLEEAIVLATGFGQPLPARAARANLAETRLVLQPHYVGLTQLGRFDPDSNAAPEPSGWMAFDEGHHGSVSIDESSKVGLVDFGNRLSHGVNHASTL